MVLSNCQHLWVFRISAADARLMETEFQEKVTVKHIISQPTFHCYARLAIPGYPLQIISVALVQPASWQDDPVRDRLVEHIRQTNQSRYLPTTAVDHRYEEHLRRFLNVNAYATKLQREARIAQAKKQQQEAAEQLAQDLKAVQLTKTTKQPTGPTHIIQPPAQAVGKQSHPQEQKPTRNHRRSRRMGKRPVGVPPPEPTPLTAQSNQPLPDDADGESRPLLFPGGTSWGTSLGQEGRERG
jgi:hypothetical protein